MPPPEGVVKRTVEKGGEPKSLTAIVFSGPFQDDPGNRINIRADGQVLETRLRKLLREKLSGLVLGRHDLHPNGQAYSRIRMPT